MKILRINFILSFFCAFALFAQIDLEINNNLFVETTNGVYLEISGDFIENGSGYLKGVVTSGNRTLETSFAGLTLSSGFTGTIKRTTWTAFSSSNPTITLRSGTAEGTSLGYRTAFVDADGNIINDTGSSGIGLPTLPGSNYLVIKHRNHLSVMSRNTIVFDWVSNQ